MSMSSLKISEDDTNLSQKLKKRIKEQINFLSDYFPENHQVLKNLCHRIIYEQRNICAKGRIFINRYKIPDPDKIYWIDPKNIEYHTNYKKSGYPDIKDSVFNMKRDKGAVYDGDWDISNFRFSDLDVFKAFAQRIRKGIEWEETSFYKKHLSQIEMGEVLWNCKNLKEWNERFKKIDSLIQSIKIKGYQLTHQVNTNYFTSTKFLCKKMSEEVTVNIGRDGQFLFQDGRHRLSIAKILQVKKIPVKILVRHKKWHDFRKELISKVQKKCIFEYPKGMSLQSPIHPDLSDIHSDVSHIFLLRGEEDRFLDTEKSMGNNHR